MLSRLVWNFAGFGHACVGFVLPVGLFTFEVVLLLDVGVELHCVLGLLGVT